MSIMRGAGSADGAASKVPARCSSENTYVPAGTAVVREQRTGQSAPASGANHVTTVPSHENVKAPPGGTVIGGSSHSRSFETQRGPPPTPSPQVLQSDYSETWIPLEIATNGSRSARKAT
jgi:hypothetical protein